MRFTFILKLPARNGGNAQMLIGEHPAAGADELAAELNAKEFIVVDEMWVDDATGTTTVSGQTILSRRAIAKVRAYRERRRREME